MPNAREIYEQQLKPDAPELLVRKLHHSVAMENDPFWAETVAKDFEALDDPQLQGATESDEEESAQMFVLRWILMKWPVCWRAECNLVTDVYRDVKTQVHQCCILIASSRLLQTAQQSTSPARAVLEHQNTISIT
jgi:hypothetical protein